MGPEVKTPWWKFLFIILPHRGETEVQRGSRSQGHIVSTNPGSRDFEQNVSWPDFLSHNVLASVCVGQTLRGDTTARRGYQHV